jgi:hypothetical protein
MQPLKSLRRASECKTESAGFDEVLLMQNFEYAALIVLRAPYVKMQSSPKYFPRVECE